MAQKRSHVEGRSIADSDTGDISCEPTPKMGAVACAMTDAQLQAPPVPTDQALEDPSKPVAAPRPNDDVLAAIQKAMQEEEEEEEEKAVMSIPVAPLVPTMTHERASYVFYPDTYHLFDTSKLVAQSEPKASTQGGGHIMFIAYIWPDGAQKPLLVQAPKLYLPVGAREFREIGKEKVDVRILGSLGREWETNPERVAYNLLCQKIIDAGVKLILAKNWDKPFAVGKVADCMTPILAASVQVDKQDPEKYTTFPPGIKLGVTTSKVNTSIFATPTPNEDGTKGLARVHYSTIVKGWSMIAVTNFQWLYRRKVQNAYKYNFAISVYQAVVFPPEGDLGNVNGENTSKLSIDF